MPYCHDQFAIAQFAHDIKNEKLADPTFVLKYIQLIITIGENVFRIDWKFRECDWDFLGCDEIVCLQLIKYEMDSAFLLRAKEIMEQWID